MLPDPSLYLFDGYNLLHAGAFADARELKDDLASFVALRGARGVVVFDGAGEDERIGPLEVRYVPHADALLERLAAESRQSERVCLVSSDSAVRRASGQGVTKLRSAAFLAELEPMPPPDAPRSTLAERLDDATRARLEELRRRG